MGLRRPKPVFTVDQYLAYERTATDRHEYLDGEIFGIAGESGAHGDISVNIVLSFGNQLRGMSCRVRTKDTKVRSGPIPRRHQNTDGLYSYPDVVVICGEPEYHDEHEDVVVNPTVIVEVISPSTEEFDRGDKFERSRDWNLTLRDYLLVSQDQPRINRFSLQDNGNWAEQLHEGLEASVEIHSIGCALKLAEVYERVNFAR